MRNKWRLVNGAELYDVRADPGQRADISAQHPDVVAALRQAYDSWWDMVSEQFDRDIPIALGRDQEPVKLTTHDLRNEACDVVWNHRQVREAKVVSGFWAVDVRHAGPYQIELRRWPQETGYEITAGIDGDDVPWRKDCIKPADASHYSGGVAIPIRWARLTIGGTSYHREVPADNTAAVYEVDLQEGADRLSAAFYDEAERVIAPYYVYVRQV